MVLFLLSGECLSVFESFSETILQMKSRLSLLFWYEICFMSYASFCINFNSNFG